VVKLRLQRTGRRNYAQFRVVATDARRPRDGGAIEVLGFCDPHGKNEVSENVKLERVDHWVSRGAQMSHSVKQIVRRVRKAQAITQAAAPVEETKVEG
jgi:small subunit ribosomal protein S16